MSEDYGDKVELYSRGDVPFGKPWEKWVESWWSWCYSKDAGKSPLLDESGELSASGQYYGPVWFLGGTFGGKAERTCQIPPNKAIFFPILNDFVSFYTDPGLATEADLHNYAKADLDNTTSLFVNVDGVELQNLNHYRVHTSLFGIALPPEEKNPAPINTKAVSDGFWIFLKPLNHGQHTIQFFGEKLEFDLALDHDQPPEDLPKFKVDVKYFLQIT